MKDMFFAITTHVSDGTASVTGSQGVFGKLYAVRYTPTDIATGATLTITCGGKTVPSKANAGTSVAWYYPRDVMNLASSGAALTGTSGYDLCEPILDGVPVVAIAAGGNSKVGNVVLYYEE